MRSSLKSANKLIHNVQQCFRDWYSRRWENIEKTYDVCFFGKFWLKYVLIKHFLKTVKGVEMTTKYIWETICFLVYQHVTWYPNMVYTIIPWICYCYFPERDSFFIVFCGDIQLPIARVHILQIYTTRVNFQYLLLLRSPFDSTTYFHLYCFK